MWVDDSELGLNQVDFRKVNWGAAQRRCYEANSARFEPNSPVAQLPTTFSVISHDFYVTEKQNSQPSPTLDERANTTLTKKYLPRTAVVVRVWDDFRLRQMDGNVGLLPRQIGGAGDAVHVDQDIRKRLLEFDQARGQPGRSQTLGTAIRISPASASVTDRPARTSSNEAASIRSTAETTCAPSAVSRVPWASRRW